MDWVAARVSVLLALSTALLLFPLALWIGRWLALGESRARALVEAVLLLPLLLPPTVIGFYLLLAFGQQSPMGVALQSWFGLQLVFSFEGLLFSSLLINLPFMVQPIHRAFAAIPHSLREAAWVSGLSPWATFRKIEMPLAYPGALAGIALTVAHTLGEFGVVLMVGGSIPAETRTLSIAIYDRVQSFDIEGASRMSLVLLACSLTALAVVLLTGARQKRALRDR